MSESPNTSTSPDGAASLERTLSDQALLIQSVREELIRSQITVLELQDTVLQKETDKADAVSLLGRAELVLEGKINYIFELDRLLNGRVRELEQELSRAKADHGSITSDLVSKLDQVNRALGDAHALAAQYARESADFRTKFEGSAVQVQQLSKQSDELQAELARVRSEKESAEVKMGELVSAKTVLERELAAIHGSLAWRMTAPFRSSSRKQS
jgi:septal ring factor EnvC (AmiA/AmiB activator)